MQERLRYSDYSIVFQEVPNEISLAFNITECPHRCPGCHSSYLSESFGNYVDDDLSRLINRYKDYITCVCFMGGDQHMEDLLKNLIYVKKLGLKTCVYSGSNSEEIFNLLLPYLDYLKIGPYMEDRGGLASPNTNQVFYKVENCCKKNITNLFWRKLC